MLWTIAPLTAAMLVTTMMSPPRVRIGPKTRSRVLLPMGKNKTKKCLAYGKPCHVNSTHANPVGDFSKAKVQKAKHSSLLLRAAGTPSYKCSAVMISPAWALTARHCLDTVSTTDIRAVLHDEYTASTVDTSDPKRDSNRREFSVVVLERGKADWALLNLVSHLPPDTKHYAKLATRKPNKAEKTLAIHHPMGQPTQASAGAVRAIDQQNPVRKTGKAVATDWFKVAPGSSGGAVFAKDGMAIGLVGGVNTSKAGGSFFIQMNTIIAESTLLKGHVLVQSVLP